MLSPYVKRGSRRCQSLAAIALYHSLVREKLLNSIWQANATSLEVSLSYYFTVSLLIFFFIADEWGREH